MKYFQYSVSFIAALALFAVPQFSLAALGVTFEATPLFSEANLMPGDAVARTVSVSNTGTDTETVEFTFDDVVSSPLADAIELAVTDGSTVFVFDTFDELFAGAPHGLGTLAPNENKTYTFTAAFPASAGNQFQSEQFSFDLRIGFVGAEQVTDRNGSGSGGTQTLQLFNELAVEEDDINGALVTWNSNRRASTYLICGNVANGPFTLTDEGPLFGYEFSLAEEDLDTTTHGSAVTDLPVGEYECRPAGRENDNQKFTVGQPVTFAVAGPLGQVEGASDSLSEADIQVLLSQFIDRQTPSSVLGNMGKGTGGMSYEAFRDELNTLKQNTETVAAAALAPPTAEAASNDNALSAPTNANGQNRGSGEQSFSFWYLIALGALLAGFWLFRRLNSR